MGRPGRRPPAAARLVAAVLLLALAHQVAGRLREARQELFPGVDGPAAGVAGSAAKLVSELSYEARRLAANVLWMRINTYVHEGKPVEKEKLLTRVRDLVAAGKDFEY
jgi:hypothetical protein